ncbi:MAG TPA: type II toxin-antitoxin system RatA family toxin [Gammaproteobacteria bacterium]|nr:type II toxin-antitoxin system RatA family toxin [Gammaproteobacteria bacterium]
MRKVHKNALVPYSAADMYALVNDVPSYPEFLPWCRGAEVLEQSPTLMRARLDLARGRFSKSFTTRNLLVPGQGITMTLEDGPFKHLEGRWRFSDLGPEGSKVELDMEFQFDSTLLDLVAGPVFEDICNSLVDAFIRRATELHGG